MTNFEKIKNMDVEEMAELIGSFDHEEDLCGFVADKIDMEFCITHECEDCARKYLESECD